jgi:hypothetical protein
LAVDVFWITKSRTIPPSLLALLNGIRKHELEEEAKCFAINHEKIMGQLEKAIEDGETLQKAKQTRDGCALKISRFVHSNCSHFHC